jgi:hypothetical protein
MNLKLRFSAVLLLALSATTTCFSQTITGFSPAFGTNNQAGIVITGTGFYPGTLTVTFNNVTAVASATSATQISAKVPATATTGPIGVRINGGSTIYSVDDFTVITPAPYITNFPTTAAVGTMITIQGVNFSGATSVKFNGTTASFTPPTSDTQIKATVPVNVTTGPISITTSRGTGTSASNFYVVPVISGFTPAAGRVGTNVVVTGKNFVGTTVVKLNGASIPFVFNSNTQLSFTIPEGGATGLIGITAPAGQTFSASNLVVAPTFLSFSPGIGKPGTNVTITGQNFMGTIGVSFNGTPASFNSVTSTQLVAVVPGNAMSGPITVTTTNGSATSAAIFYIPPSINNFNPTNGVPGTVVTIGGANFTNATDVSFNGASAAFTVVNNTTITATIPAGASSGLISVTTPGGTASTVPTFYILPIVSGFTPGSGVAGTSVIVNGSSFLDATAVLFNGVNASFTPGGNSQLTAIVPAGATTGPISVVAPGGTGVGATAFVIDALKLGIRLLTNNAVAVSWTTNAAGFSLQANTNLNFTNGWLTVTNVPVVVNGKNTVTNSLTNTAVFYRLKNN